MMKYPALKEFLKKNFVEENVFKYITKNCIPVSREDFFTILYDFLFTINTENKLKLDVWVNGLPGEVIYLHLVNREGKEDSFSTLGYHKIVGLSEPEYYVCKDLKSEIDKKIN